MFRLPPATAAQKPHKRDYSGTLEDLVSAARNVGAEVTVQLVPKKMPMRSENDTEAVRLLLDESERLNALGDNWANSKPSNPIATETAYRNGWAFALAAAWLRVKLNGELEKHKE